MTVVNNDARNSRSQGSNDRFPTRSAVRFETSLFFAAEISEEKTRVGGSRVVSRVNGAKSPGSTVVRARSSSESEDSEPEARVESFAERERFCRRRRRARRSARRRRRAAARRARASLVSRSTASRSISQARSKSRLRTRSTRESETRARTVVGRRPSNRIAVSPKVAPGFRDATALSRANPCASSWVMNTSNRPFSTMHIVPSVSAPSRHTTSPRAYVSNRESSSNPEVEASSRPERPRTRPVVDASASQARAACLSPAVAGLDSSASATARVHSASLGPSPSARLRRRRRVSHWRHSQ